MVEYSRCADVEVVRSRKQQYVFELLARFGVYFTIIMLPISHFLVNQGLVFSTVCVILSGGFKEKIALIKKITPITWVLVFIAFMLLTSLYSSVGILHGLSGACKYTKLLYMIFIIPLFIEPTYRRQACSCFIYALFIICVWSLLVMHHWVNASFIFHHGKIFAVPSANGVTVNILNLSVLLAIALYLLLFRLKDNLKNIPHWIIFTVMFVYLFNFNHELTGCLGFILLFLYFMATNFGLKKTLAAFIFVVAGCFFIFSSANSLKTKVVSFYHTVTTKTQKRMNISTGYRLGFIKGSLKTIKKNPILGTGAGSFMVEYDKAGGKQWPNGNKLWEPHNAFLNLTVQAGLIGLFLLIGFIISLWLFAGRLLGDEKWMFTGVILMMLFNSITNAVWVSNTVGMTYVILFSIFIASSYKNMKMQS